MKDFTGRLFVVILAGGVGTRLWPLSTPSFPKQFLTLYGDKSLLQTTVARCQFIQHDTRFIAISTNEAYRGIVEQQLMGTGITDFIIEPAKRNTAPAIALILKYLVEYKNASEGDLVLVCPSDHYISPRQRFASYVQGACCYALQGSIVLFGIQPTTPETGYGYIKINENEQPGQFGYRIQKFVEKPDFETAKHYVALGNYFWNTGIFLFSIKTMIQEMQIYVPVLGNALGDSYETFLAQFETFPDISIDYAVMEKTDKAMLVPMTLQWSDLGCWDSIREWGPKDDMHNVVKGDVLLHNARNNLVISDRKVVVDGVDNLLIVESPDGLYITTKGSSQNIKKFFQDT